MFQVKTEILNMQKISECPCEKCLILPVCKNKKSYYLLTLMCSLIDSYLDINLPVNKSN